MQKERKNVVVKNRVILNSFQDLHPLFSTRAFTLIELLVVVLIIGILAAVAVPQYQKAVDKAQLTEALVLGDYFRKLEKMYYLTNGNYTTNFEDLGIDIPSGYFINKNAKGELKKENTKAAFALENSANKRVIFRYYGKTDELQLALFFWFEKTTVCHPYTDRGTILCKSLRF